MNDKRKEMMDHEVFRLTWYNVIQPDVNIVIPVCSGLFMIKPQSVEQLMFNHCLVVTACAQRQNLANLLVTNAGETSMKVQTVKESQLKLEPINKAAFRESLVNFNVLLYKLVSIVQQLLAEDFVNAAIPSSLFKLDECLLSLIRLEVNTRLQPIHFKSLVDAALGIQI